MTALLFGIHPALAAIAVVMFIAATTWAFVLEPRWERRLIERETAAFRPLCDHYCCERELAAWAYIGEGGDLYLCDKHFQSCAAHPNEWTRIDGQEAAA